MVRNVLSNWIGLIVVGAISVMLTPILIHGLGNFNYGMWVLVASVLDYYGLLDLGMRWSLFRFVARFKGANQRSDLSQTFATALSITIGIALFLIGLTLLLAAILPTFLKLTGLTGQEFRWVLLLVGFSAAVTFPVQLLGAYLRGLQRFDLDNLGLIITAVLRAGLLAAVLRLGRGIVALAGVSLTISLLSTILYWKLVRWADPELSVSRGDITWGRARELVQARGLRLYENNRPAARSARVLRLRMLTLDRDIVVPVDDLLERKGRHR